MYFLLGSWQAEGHSLLVSHIFDLGIITTPICRVDQRAKFFPLLWEPVIPLRISGSPLSRFYKHGVSTCFGVGPGTPESPSPFPRRVVSSSGVGKGPDSSSTGLNRDASITASPLRVINGDMYCWSSLTALHRMPGLAPNASAQVYSTLAKAIVFCQISQNFWGSEAGGESPVDKACVALVGHPTTWRLLVVPLAA